MGMSEKLGQLDLVFVVDNTGSMGPYINVAKSKILEIIRTIKKEELCHSLRVGLVPYRDHPPEERTFVTKKFHLTDDTAVIERNVRSMSAYGGGDGPEAVDDGLRDAINLEWNGEAAKVIVLVGDAPPHGVEPGDRWPKGPPSGVHWEEEAMNAYYEGIIVHTVGCFPEISRYSNAVTVWKKIAAASEGRFFPLDEAENLVQIITGVAIEEIDKIAIQQAIMSELRISAIEDFPSEEELTEERVAELATKVRAGGLKKRAVTKAPASASALGTERFTLEEKEVSDADIKEAFRQLKKKADK
jgi:Mg-chelatase subunit ChlD